MPLFTMVLVNSRVPTLAEASLALDAEAREDSRAASSALPPLSFFLRPTPNPTPSPTASATRSTMMPASKAFLRLYQGIPAP